MKALAFEIEGKLLCCSCVSKTLAESEYFHLFFSFNLPKKVDAKMKCEECKDTYGGKKAGVAAAAIARRLNE